MAADISAAVAFLAEAGATVQAALERWLPDEREAAAAPRLAEAMRYSALAPGKRLRPALALAGARAVGGSDADALPYACALELIHTYSLIHDDLPAMDDDDLRRGRPTSHKVYGDALAILAGDALHTLAFELVLRETSDPARAGLLARELAVASGYHGMVGGQVADLAAGGGVPDAEVLEAIHRRKTGALIAAAVRGGARAAGADDATLAAFGNFGAALGLAFQITDDILDVTGSAAALGKTPGKDERESKLTYVALLGLDGARARADREVERALEALRGIAGTELLGAIAHFVAHRDR